MRRFLGQLYRSNATLALLAVVLLAAQAIVLVHDTDSEAHASDHPCEVCVSASVLGGGNVAVIEHPLPVAADESIVQAPVAFVATIAVRNTSARGPPLTS